MKYKFLRPWWQSKIWNWKIDTLWHTTMESWHASFSVPTGFHNSFGVPLQFFKFPIHTLGVPGLYGFVCAPRSSSKVLQKLDGSAWFCLGWKGLNSEAYERYWFKRVCGVMILLDVIQMSDWHVVSFKDNCCKNTVVETKWA